MEQPALYNPGPRDGISTGAQLGGPGGPAASVLPVIGGGVCLWCGGYADCDEACKSLLAARGLNPPVEKALCPPLLKESGIRSRSTLQEG